MCIRSSQTLTSLTVSSSRLSVICRLGKLGLRFTPEKQQALLDGDISGAIIHPFFIRATHPLGMHFCEGINHSPAMVTLYAQYVQRSLELLIEVIKEISPNPDWELQAQVALWVTSGSIIMRLHHVTPTYIKKACEAVNLGGLRFVPSYGRPPPFSDALHEKLSVLSQIIYFDNFWFLACGGPQPTLTAKIEEEFSHQLEVTPTISYSSVAYIQNFIAGNLSGLVQHLPVNHAHQRHFTGQRHRLHPQHSPN